MKRYQPLFETHTDDDVILMLKDAIDVTWEKGDKASVVKYQKTLHDKYGVDYSPENKLKTDEQMIKNPDLNDIKTKEDFSNFNNFRRYTYNLFSLRFHTYKKFLQDKPIYTTLQEVIDLCLTLDIPVKTKKLNTAEAHVINEIIYFDPKYMDSKIYFGISVHELGHVLDDKNGNRYSNMKISELQNASNVYSAANHPGEVFPDHVMNYFLEPKYLKAGWSEVYTTLNKIIPSNWKKEINKLIGK